MSGFQLWAIRLIAGLYSLCFLALACSILLECRATSAWHNNTHETSILAAAAALSGWFDKALAFENFLFGLGGGLMARSSTKISRFATFLNYLIVGSALFTVLITLIDLWAISMNYSYIRTSYNEFAGDHPQLKVSDAISTIGALNLSVAAGFLTGLAIPGRTWT